MEDKTKQILIKAGIGVGGAAVGFLAAKALCGKKRGVSGLSGIGYKRKSKRRKNKSLGVLRLK